MKNILGQKSFVMILGIVAILIMVYLTAGLSSLEFKPAESFAVKDAPTPVPVTMEQQPVSLDSQTVLTWSALILTVIALLYLILDREQRKRLLRVIIRVMIYGVMIFLLVSEFGGAKRLSQGDENGEVGLLNRNLMTVQAKAPPPFIPPQWPAWALYLATLGTILVVAGVVWLVVRWNRSRHATTPLEELAHIARSALDDIQAGNDWEDTVIQCYIRMGAAVNSRRGLVRQSAMTPTEFAAQLEAVGLPGDAVRRLTTLFERVRYGAKKSTRQDISEAVDSLTIILHACREAV